VPQASSCRHRRYTCCFLALAWLLHRLWHLALPRNLWTHYFGWGLIDLGVLLMLWAGLLMLWRKTTVNPYGKPARLLEEGPFRFSRNPIYLADSLIYCGIALLWGSLWPWLLLPVGSVAVSYAAAPEPVFARSKARGVKFGHSK